MTQDIGRSADADGLSSLRDEAPSGSSPKASIPSANTIGYAVATLGWLLKDGRYQLSLNIVSAGSEDEARGVALRAFQDNFPGIAVAHVLASAIEAQRAATAQTDAVHESAVPQGDATPTPRGSK